ncbi:hypothetical protein TH25_21310 [Thalassospira profundimaris]|uniref:Uncharacterized protein n=1 Tax=Thalassospira profundimaris TaxID=502049 RepID=A0A367WQM5_9PROT|nr:hypothetical protein [Thalassospira profundimaris]RCK43688.1 hypothetical protein TH25_21310 [Thalassospira profundimaris]
MEFENTPVANAISCFMCEPMERYLDAAAGYTDALSNVLTTPMAVIFGSVVAIWFIVHGIKMVMAKSDLIGFSHELFFITIGAGLLSGQGAILVNLIYNTSLATMGGAASVVLKAAATAGGEVNDLIRDAAVSYTGMTQLVYIAEIGFRAVIEMAFAVWSEFSLGNLMAGVYGVLIAIPWLLLMVIYFSQIAVSIFRVMMLAALSPYLMMGIGFGWSRGMVVQALKSLLAAYMVLFGATLAIGLVLYAVAALQLDGYVDASGDLQDMKVIVPVVLGWMGFAFVTEATGMANSITQSQFTNSAVAAMTGGALATGMSIFKNVKSGRLLNAARGASGAAANAFGAGQSFFADPKGHASSFADRFNAHRERVAERLKNPTSNKGSGK